MGNSVLVIGGDGFCGWPICLSLSSKGYDVTMVDDLSRRTLDVELGTRSLTPIATVPNRLECWAAYTGKRINYSSLCIGSDFELCNLIINLKPHTIVHAAALKSAPYSMKSHWHRHKTLTNNVAITSEILSAIAHSRINTHLIHIGSIGAYGYGPDLPPLPVHADGSPGNPGILQIESHPRSIYHLSKRIDQCMLEFYSRVYGMRVTELQQGIVWGCETSETRFDRSLINRFDIDPDYGTAVHRFLFQAASHEPITVHGSGGQQRGFIHLVDVVKTVLECVDDPPTALFPMRVVNNVTEVTSILDLATMVSRISESLIDFIPTPRQEPSENILLVLKDKQFNSRADQIHLSVATLTDLLQWIRDLLHHDTV